MQRTYPLVASRKATTFLRHLPVIFLTTAGLALAPFALAGELVVNGSFELPEVPVVEPAEHSWATYFGQNGAALAGDYCATHAMDAHCIDGVLVPGWSAVWNTPDGITDEPGRIELQFGVYNGCTAYEGFQKAELDSHHHYDNTGAGDNNIYLYQMLPTCPRSPYVLDYAWKPRRDSTSALEVWVGGDLLCEHIGWEDTWLPVTVYFVTGDVPGTELGFESCGGGDTYGAFVDAVSVVGPRQDDPDCYEPNPICGERPDHLTLLYDGDPNGMDYHGQAPGNVFVETFTTDPLPDMVQITAYDWRGKFKNRDHGKKVGDQGIVFGPQVIMRNGELFTIEASSQKWVPPNMFFEIRSEGGELLQTVQFHTSCSQPLNVGDEYGAIVIWEGGRY